MSRVFGSFVLSGIPDWAVYRIARDSPNEIDDIVGLVSENKREEHQTSSDVLGQVTAQAFTACLLNYYKSNQNIPICAVLGRGHCLSFMHISFPDEYIKTIRTGKLPSQPARALIFPPQETLEDIHGYNLLQQDGRREAFESLCYLRNFLGQTHNRSPTQQL